MSDVTTSVDVHVPVRTAYNQWTQFESFPEFMSGVVAIRQLDDRRTHWVTEVAGTHREFDAEIVEQRPDERIAWRSMEGDVQHSGVVTFQSLGDRETRVTVDLVWQPEGLMEKAGDLIGIDRLQVKADLERFRQFIEERGVETGQWRGAVPASGGRDGAAGAAGATGAVAGTAAAGTAAVAGTTAAAPGTGTQGDGRLDVVDMLIAQHGRVKDLMDRISDADGPDKQQMFTDLVELLKVHENGEQHVVHPVTRTSTEDGAATANARLGEEQRADILLSQIGDMSTNSREFDTWFEQLRQAVLAHAEHEEREEFPKLRRDVAPARLMTMAEELVSVQTARN